MNQYELLSESRTITALVVLVVAGALSLIFTRILLAIEARAYKKMLDRRAKEHIVGENGVLRSAEMRIMQQATELRSEVARLREEVNDLKRGQQA
ncbi:MAG TPA: hypothetical protein VF590_08555 [Isosphaeraceae bacterium]|jgi:hypothetical protein